MGAMVFFTIFATIDSLTLLGAMTGMVVSSALSLKAIADLEHDIINHQEFFSNMKFAHRAEYTALAVNVLACMPFLFDWWMAVPQLGWALLKAFRLIINGHKIEEREVDLPKTQHHHRRWHMTGLFLALISWFIHFARAITAIMDIHVHGISPYD